MDDDLVDIAAEIRSAESVVALTGAGVSTASGIPDFRSEDGIWSEYDPMDFHLTRFRADPGGFWRDRVGMIEDLFAGDPEPNAAHESLAALESAGQLDTLVTQNVDGLHRAAGSNTPIDIHGNGRRVVCTDCGVKGGVERAMECVRGGETPPTCERCGGVFKPDVVLFGEELSKEKLARSRSAAEGADVFLAIGTSLSVEPVASLPRHALDAGGTVCVVNLDRTGVSADAEYDIRADVTDVLPQVTDQVLVR
ncbi:MAG: NAD-dependent deacetylase [Natronomonas sp.]|jgi:NAD-dependent deacetylase|uniref:SIR2 family NAD-dependent protein deacylase n=1 Tax=Natronomonas sp. TaxID=2184060 RepID=UPI003989BD48